MFPVRLTGPRVVLREYESTDAAAVQRWAADPEVVEHLVWGPNSWDETVQHVEGRIAMARDPARTVYCLAIEMDGDVIGSVELRVESDAHRRGSIGYVLRRDRWGRGVMTEAAGLLVDFGFRSLGLRRVWAVCDSSNPGSARVLEKLGMTREGCFREDLLIRGRWRSSLVYGVLEHEWGVQ